MSSSSLGSVSVVCQCSLSGLSELTFAFPFIFGGDEKSGEGDGSASEGGISSSTESSAPKNVSPWSHSFEISSESRSSKSMATGSDWFQEYRVDRILRNS